MYKKNRLYLFSKLMFFVFSTFSCLGQEKVTLNHFLNQLENSNRYEFLKNSYRISENNYKIFKISYLPQFTINLSLPNYNRSINQVTQPDGTYKFIETNQASSNVNLSISQKIPWTGGTVNISNSLNQFNRFGSDNYTSYSASWFSIRISQPLNFFNEFKWDNKINTNEQEINKLLFEKEKINLEETTVLYYIDLYSLIKKTEILNDELKILNELENKFIILNQVGDIHNIELLEIKLKKLDLESQVRETKKDLSAKTKEVNIFFNQNIISDCTYLEELIFDINFENITNYVDIIENNEEILANRKILPLKKNITESKKNKFYSAQISLGIGYNNNSNSFSSVFQDPNHSQNITLSLSIPIINYGKNKLQLSNLEYQYENEILELDEKKNYVNNNIISTYHKLETNLEKIKIINQKTVLYEKKLFLSSELLINKKILLSDFNQILIEKKKSYFTKFQILKQVAKDSYYIEKNILKKIIQWK